MGQNDFRPTRFIAWLSKNHEPFLQSNVVELPGKVWSFHTWQGDIGRPHRPHEIGSDLLQRCLGRAVEGTGWYATEDQKRSFWSQCVEIWNDGHRVEAGRSCHRGRRWFWACQWQSSRLGWGSRGWTGLGKRHLFRLRRGTCRGHPCSQNGQRSETSRGHKLVATPKIEDASLNPGGAHQILDVWKESSDGQWKPL